MSELVKYQEIPNIVKIAEALNGASVVVQEKLDGSNVAVAKVDGKIVFQSRNQILDPYEIVNPSKPKGIFGPFLVWGQQALAQGLFAFMMNGEVLYGETLNGQGKLKYEHQTPFVLFDFKWNNGTWALGLDSLAAALGVPCAPTYFEGTWGEGIWNRGIGLADLDEFLKRESILGGPIEGVVIKADYRTDQWGHRLIGKYVSEAFREKEREPKPVKEIDGQLDELVEVFLTPARFGKCWTKALEMGKDPERKPHELIGIISQDIHKEAQDEIKEALFKFYWKALAGKIAKQVLVMHDQRGL